MTRYLSTLARWRVPLGFLAAVIVMVDASPTWSSWRAGIVVAGVGEVFRVWAAGHLIKSQEVTRSGPYRWTRHPLYVGSALIATGLALATASVVSAVCITVYMVATTGAAIVSEEAFLSERFGDAYRQYRASGGTPMERAFSLKRAYANREHRAVIGLVMGCALLALKVWVLL